MLDPGLYLRHVDKLRDVLLHRRRRDVRLLDVLQDESEVSRHAPLLQTSPSRDLLQSSAHATLPASQVDRRGSHSQNGFALGDLHPRRRPVDLRCSLRDVVWEVQALAEFAYARENVGGTPLLARYRPDPRLPLLHLLDACPHRRVEVLAVRVAHRRADLRRQPEVMEGERRRGTDPHSLVLLLQVHRLPLGPFVGGGESDVAAGRADELSLLCVSYETVPADRAGGTEDAVLRLFPQISSPHLFRKTRSPFLPPTRLLVGATEA